MKRFKGMAATVVALAFASVAVDAHAQSRPAKPRPRLEVANASPAATANDWGPQNRRRSLELNSDGRWALKLDYDQPTTRDMQWRDVEAGAYYRVNPSLRVGGAVGLGSTNRTPNAITDDERPAPRVRLETTFRF
ncbi:MAG: hypothetical protein K1X35_09270 [Caulobacteraceae bacterium]|nr:hypothetical protein [Caulobacteraceae bacterium]